MKKRPNRLLLATLYTLLFVGHSALYAQQNLKVLFLGNSYTSVNNLPQLVRDLAQSTGDTLNFDSNTPGGATLLDHSGLTASQSKIMVGDWDYVVVQGQSREPILSSTYFRNGMASLYNQIRQYNACSTIMPFMTWGRRNGDADNCADHPVMCTYASMDSALRVEYMELTSTVNGEVSPVSVVWRYLRENHPSLELYHADGSHPSYAGSYAAACCFYTAIFKKDPTLITYNGSLSAADAKTIRDAAKAMVYDSLQTWNLKQKAKANFTFSIGSGSNEVRLRPINITGVRQDYSWDFGDGNTSLQSNPTHNYATDGSYTIQLTTSNCDLQGTYTSTKDTTIQFCSHTPTVTFNGPDLCQYDTLWTEPADTYQWFSHGSAIPETNHSIIDYQRYSISGFTVLSTVNGCSELSQVFSDSPTWSGYYYDVPGYPCDGDTATFMVLHTSGSLNGSETILWYKDGQPISSASGQDTLFITEGGSYTCKVVNPLASCPDDTTFYTVTYDCDTAVINGWYAEESKLNGRLYPNPASDYLIVEFSEPVAGGILQLFHASGVLIREVEITGTMNLTLDELDPGMYFLRLKNKDLPTLRFIKN